MATKKYPVGTKIRYVGVTEITFDAKKDIGKCGTIVGHRPCGCSFSIDGVCPNIYLPESTHKATTFSEVLVTWRTGWAMIELAIQKGEQLQFAFMEEGNA